MSIRKITTAAALGIAVLAAAPALAEPAEDTRPFLTTPGIGVVENVGNAQAAGQPLFGTGERPQAERLYDVESGTYVARGGGAKAGETEQAMGPAIDFGLDVN